MWPCFRVIGIVASFYACATLTIASNMDPDLQQRFLTEAPKSWAAVREIVKHWSGEIISTNVFTAPGKPPVTKRYRTTYCLKGELFRWEGVNIPDDGRKSVRIINSGYSATVHREKNQPAYYLGGYGRPDDSNLLGEQLAGAFAGLYAAEAMDMYLLHEVLEEKQSRLVSVEPVKRDGKELVRVEFERTFLKGNICHLWAVLDPSYQWSVQESGIDHGTWTEVRTIEYQKDLEVPFPKTIVTVVTMKKDGTLVEKTESIFDVPRPCTADASEFTLNAFGLPEVSSGGARTSRAIWFLIPTLIFLFVIFILRRFRRAKA